MESLAAFGLAGTVVQFFDFSCNLLFGAKSLYESSTGASAENLVIETITNNLIQLNDALTAPSAPGAIPDQLRKLASHCKSVARDLLEVLEEVKVKGSHRKFKSFVKAVEGACKKGKVESLSKRLEALRNQMQYGLQMTLM